METTQRGTVEYLTSPYRRVDRPLVWQLAGREETRSGYGNRLTSTWCLQIEGEPRLRRIYVVCWSNAGTAYIRSHGRMIVLDPSWEVR